MALNATVPPSYRGDHAQVSPSHKKDEAKIIFIGSVVFLAYRALTAPFRWVWNNTVYGVIQFFNLAGRVQPTHQDDLARFRESISQKMQAASRAAPAKEGNAHRSQGSVLPVSSKNSEYVPLEDSDLEALRQSLDHLVKNATQILYAKKADNVLGFFSDLPGLDAGPLIEWGFSPHYLALNEPVLHLLLNGKGPTLEERRKKTGCQDLDEHEILQLEHISMQDSLASVYQFLTKETNWGELKASLSDKVDAASYESSFTIVRDWLCEGINKGNPFVQYARNYDSRVNLRNLANIYAQVTKALLIEKTRVLSVQKIPTFGKNLKENLAKTLASAAPRVADHLVLQGVDLLEKAPMSQIIDDAVATFHTFFNASLVVGEDDFAAEFLFTLTKRGIHCDPETAITGVTREWVREHICMPFRDLLFSSHDAVEGGDVKALGSFLSRIVDEIELPDEFHEIADFGLNLIKSYKPGSFCVDRFREYCSLLVKGSFFHDIMDKLNTQGPQTIKGAKLIVLEEIVDRVLAGVITPRIHEAFNPRKVEMFLAKKLLPEATDALMTAFIEMIASSPPYEEVFDEELESAAQIVYEKLKSVCSIGRNGYLLNRYSYTNCRELLRKYLEETRQATYRNDFTEEELLPYQNLLNSVIMDAAKISEQGNWLMNFGCKTIMPTLINKVLAPNVLQALEGYRSGSQKLVKDLTSLINEKALARDPGRPIQEEGPSSGSPVAIEDTLLYSMMMNDKEEVESPEPALDEFHPDFVNECDLLASILYDMSSYQASKITGGLIGLKALLGKDQKELVRIINSVAFPILRRPLVAELLISRVATQTLSSLQKAHCSQPRFSRNLA